MISRLTVAGANPEALPGRSSDGNGRVPTSQNTALKIEQGETRRLAAPGGTTRAENGSGGGTMEVNQVQGRVQAQSIRRLTDLVEQYPDESLSIVRGWLSEGEKE